MKNKHASWQAQQKRKTHKFQMEILHKLLHHTQVRHELGITEDRVRSTVRKLRTAYYDSCKTFTVCPTCDYALTGKKRRKAVKSLTEYECNICGKGTWTYDGHAIGKQNRIIHHTETLAEARLTIRKTHPELFL